MKDLIIAVINAEYINVWFCSFKDSSCMVTFQGYKINVANF
jgi:hypothetical protein